MMLKNFFFNLWQKRINHAKEGARAFACRRLAGLGDDRAVALLLNKLNDSSAMVRAAACQAFAKLISPQAVGPLVNRLADQPSVSQVARRTLYVYDSAAIQPLIDYINNHRNPSDGLVNSCYTLIDLKATQAFDAVVSLLNHNDAGVNMAACRALEKFGNKAAVQPLIAQLTPKPPDVRRAICHALGELKDSGAVNPLIWHLADPDAEVRHQAGIALTKLNESEIRVAVERILSPDTSFLKFTGLKKRTKANDFRAIVPLLRWAPGADSVTYAAIIKALFILGEASLDVLVHNLSFPLPGARRALCEVLADFRTQASVQALIDCLTDKDPGVRCASADSLGKTGSTQAVAPLLTSLTDDDSAVCRAVVRSLAKINDKAAVEPLISRLATANSDLKTEICAALGRLGDSRAVSALIGHLSHPAQDVHTAAGKALIGVGETTLGKAFLEAFEPGFSTKLIYQKLTANHDDRLVPTFRSLLSHREWPVRKAACYGLGKLRNNAAVDDLVPVLHDNNSTVKETGARALREIYKHLKSQAKMLYCQECQARFEKKTAVYEIEFKNADGAKIQRSDSAPYWACRLCHKAARAMFGIRDVQAILDTSRNVTIETVPDGLQINFLALRTYFDFDNVYIIEASDDDVERFCIHLGNDVDDFRHGSYKTKQCQIASNVRLSNHTRRQLESIFKKVTLID